MLHVASDDERKKLAALDGLRVTMKSAEHYGDEIWLTFAKAEGTVESGSHETELWLRDHDGSK